MKTKASHSSSFFFHPLLSHLWLHEPDAETIAQATRELGLPLAVPTELASAYTDVFLLNVPPYGTAFTDLDGELNGPGAQRLTALFESHGYQPPELHEVGAADHVGLCLGFLGAFGGLEIGELSLDWIPVCCLAVEREPVAPPFYRALASHTRNVLFSESATRNPQHAITDNQLPITNYSPDDELTLRDLLRFFLAPARCGVFLSRSRLGQIAILLGMPLPFGSRFDVAEMLFASAGEAQQLPELLAALEIEIGVWSAEYRRWAEVYPAWRPAAEGWLARTADAASVLSEMRALAAMPI